MCDVLNFADYQKKFIKYPIRLPLICLEKINALNIFQNGGLSNLREHCMLIIVSLQFNIE